MSLVVTMVRTPINIAVSNADISYLNIPCLLCGKISVSCDCVSIITFCSFLSYIYTNSSSFSMAQQPEVDHWPSNLLVQRFFFPNFSRSRPACCLISTALTHLFLGLPTGLFLVKLLSRILFGVRFPSMPWTSQFFQFNNI